jgi:hypothetical protein
VSILAVLMMSGVSGAVGAKEKVEKPASQPSSYAPVVIKEPFATTMEALKKEKPQVMNRQLELLKKRYDLENKPTKGVTMSRGKAVQEGVRVLLPAGQTWDKLAGLTPE